MPRFDRVYSLIVGQPSKSGAGGEGVEIEDLRITFEVVKTDQKNPNKSKIEVWNAAPATRALMERPDTRCVLRAGYVEEDGALEVFQGDVTFAWTRYDEADVVTTLELGDGAKAIRNSVVSLGYGKGAATRKVLTDIAGKMGLTLSMPDDAPVRTWEHGVSFHGSARAALDRVTRAAGLSWSIQGGVLQVIATNGATNRGVVDLAADSGLIGNPERQRKGNAEAIVVKDVQTKRPARAASATQAWDGWRVKSLLLPFIVPGDRVKLSSRSVDGVFRVRDLKHHGDSHDGDWITELRLVDLPTFNRLAAADAAKAAKKAKTAAARAAKAKTP